jgi:hypothetical protein
MKLIGVCGQLGSGKDTVADRLADGHRLMRIALADPIKRFGKHVFGFTDKQLWGPSEFRNAFDARFHTCEILSSGVRLTPTTRMSDLRKVCDPGWSTSAANLLDYGPGWVKDLVPEANQAEVFDLLLFWFESLGNKYPELSPRIALQHLGTEWGRRAVGDDVWVDYMVRIAREAMDGQYVYDHKNGLLRDQSSSHIGVVVSDIRFKNEIDAIRARGGKVIRVHRPDTDTGAVGTGITAHASEVEQQSFSDDMFDIVVMNNRTLEDLFDIVDSIARAL